MTIPADGGSCSFAATPAAAASARAALADVARELPEAAAFDLRLLVTEVIAQRILYGALAAGDTIELRIANEHGRVVVSTLDHGAPVERAAAGGVLGGSLDLVDALAEGWGADHRGGATRVWFELDAERDDAASALPARARAVEEHAVRVVIAEDYRLFAQTLAMRLELDERVRVVGIAEDGAQLVALVEKLEPDVALVDIVMPRLDGLEAAERVRALRAPTVVAVMSGHDDVVDEVRAAGADAFVSKDDLARDPVEIVLRLAAPDVASR